MYAIRSYYDTGDKYIESHQAGNEGVNPEKSGKIIKQQANDYTGAGVKVGEKMSAVST